MAATAARAEPMAKVMVMVWLTLMPMSSAAPLSSDTARMALPMRVLLMNRVRPIIITAVTTRVARVIPSIYTAPSSMVGREITVGKDFCSGPKISRARFCSR